MTLSLPLGISDPPDVSRKFPGRYESLAKIGQFIRSQAQQSGLDEKAVYQVEMAVDEACSNIIEHAYGDENKGDISVTCRISEEGLTIVLSDTGKSFDPNSISLPDLSTGLEERESHGLGMFFIREWMDKVEYENKAGVGNILTLLKRRGGSRKVSSMTAYRP